MLKFQDTLSQAQSTWYACDRSVALCVALCHLPTRTFPSLEERSSLKGSRPCKSWNVVFKCFLPLLRGIVLWWFFSAFGDGQKHLHWPSETSLVWSPVRLGKQLGLEENAKDDPRGPTGALFCRNEGNREGSSLAIQQLSIGKHESLCFIREASR